MEYDVVIVGGDASGPACAIRLKQQKPDLEVWLLDKAASVGAHALSGSMLETRLLDALLPEWRAECAGIKEMSDQIWLVSFMEYDLGYFDQDEDRVEPSPNPFAPDTLLTMCPE